MSKEHYFMPARVCMNHTIAWLRKTCVSVKLFKKCVCVWGGGNSYAHTRAERDFFNHKVSYGVERPYVSKHFSVTNVPN